ncbi:MAG: cupin domain-containing protein [Dehalococcoidia bacterium]|nr:cupin domain-containing protein [Dehalococcoidia bacterium]
MAEHKHEIVNPRTGQRMLFLKTSDDTHGELLQIECFSPPHGPMEPEHVHPRQEHRFQVLSGSLAFRIRGEETIVREGGAITIPPNAPHHFWNSGEEEAHYIQEFRPALRIDLFFETLFGLARDGKLNDRGVPNLLQAAVLVPDFSDEIRLTRPPWAVQRAVFAVLAPMARLRGYRASPKSR